MPVWLTAAGERIAFFTQTTSSKAKNPRHDSRALATTVRELPFRHS